MKTEHRLLVVFLAVIAGVFIAIAAVPGLRPWAMPQPEPKKPSADRFQSDPNNLCYFLDRPILETMVSEVKFAGPWEATGREFNFPGGSESGKAMQCEAVRTSLVSEQKVSLMLNFNSDKQDDPNRGSDFPVTERFGWIRNDFPIAIPDSWGTGGVSPQGNGALRRACPSNAYYEIVIYLIGKDLPKGSTKTAGNARNLLQAAMQKIDAMPFCSGKG
jgi:hypothetical protein